MSRKTHKYTAVAVTATLSFSLASAEISSAFARVSEQGIETTASAQDAEQAVGPIFISREVVQPIPHESDAAAVDAQQAEDGKAAGSLKDLVTRTETGFDLSEQMQCLAGAVYFESRGEPLTGQLAVAQVVINRADSKRFPESYCDVVFQRAQFSFVKNGEMPRIRTGSQAWHRAKAIARIAHEGMWESEAGDSLYFHAKYVSPRWSRQKVARATINQHIFYR